MRRSRRLAAAVGLSFALLWATALASPTEIADAFAVGAFDQALAAARPRAEQGDAEAQYWLGRLHDAGQAGSSTPRAAFDWF